MVSAESGRRGEQRTDNQEMEQEENFSHLQHLDACLADVNDDLKEIMQTGLREQLETLQSPVERAQFVLNVAYAINSLFFGAFIPLGKANRTVYLRTQGHNTKDHPVMQELDRVKTYFQKLTDVSKPRPLSLDKDASKRFVTAALGIRKSEKGDSKSEKGDSRPSTPIPRQAPKGDKL